MTYVHPQLKLMANLVIGIVKIIIAILGFVLSIIALTLKGFYFIFNRIGRIINWSAFRIADINDYLYDFICKF